MKTTAGSAILFHKASLLKNRMTLSVCCCCLSDTGEATLRIVGVTFEDDGVYTCVATNELGSVASSASLRVLGRSKANGAKRLFCEEIDVCVIAFVFFRCVE